MKVVCISGGFDPFHEGHLDYMTEASKLGDYLVVLLSNDEDIIRKKGKCNLPMWFRVRTITSWLKNCNIGGKAISTIDTDGTQIKTLRMIKPDIYAEGGDINPNNINKEEERICKEIGCTIIYNVGGKKTNSSSEMVISSAR